MSQMIEEQTLDKTAIEQVEAEAQAEVKDVPVSAAAWLAEIAAAEKRERDWRKEAKKALDRYSNQDDAAGTFNILWSNTETIRNAVYNQPPSPDVRQRWDSKDPKALAVAQVLDRALEYVIDVGNFDDAARKAVMDMLLPGRAVMRVRYEPEFTRQAGPDGVFYDAVAKENVVFEPVGYRDFVHHDAPDWRRVEWVAFKHNMTKADVGAQFPDFVDQLSYSNAETTEDGEQRHMEMEDAQSHTDMDARATVWEVWDRRSKTVIWVSKGVASALDRSAPPLDLAGFYPIAQPLLAISQPESLVPTTLYSQYEAQAAELDNISRRIENTAAIVKWRGLYDGSLGHELETFFDKAQDGDLVPTDATTILMERGGFQNAMWLFPVKEAVETLKTLYETREATKQTIYEITGISDIMRGVTQASETATAQQIKATWGSSRMDGYKREIQRFLAETIRIAAEILAETYQTETLAKITGLSFPSMQDKQQAQMQLQRGQQQGQQLQMAAQQDPKAQELLKALEGEMKKAQKVLEQPAWEELAEVMTNDLERSYKVDIETDSTITPNQQEDLKNLSETMQAIGLFGQQFLPGVQNGIVPPQMFVQILASIIRKTPLTNDLTPYFDDYLDQMGADNPLQKQIDGLKDELKQAKDEKAIKEQEIKLKAAEIQQRGLLEGERLKLDAVELQQRSMQEQNKIQAKFNEKLLDAQAQQPVALGV